ncbi:hypothetical protein G6F31_019626 [Rhizopus arrhizus]|nr:hypothetical protein G6F31_019626 [Rhizopus arrhizus]
MGHDARGISVRRIIVRRGVDVGNDIQVVQLVLDRMNIDLARFILREGAGVDQRKGILLVVGCGSGGAHYWNSYDCTGDSERGCAEKIASGSADKWSFHLNSHCC